MERTTGPALSTTFNKTITANGSPGRQGIAHCCDGLCEQPNVDQLDKPIRRP
jgi:hypothetical protein